MENCARGKLEILFLLNLALYVKGEYCPAYYDFRHNIRPGFHCPSAIRLVGLSDFYCCRNNRISTTVFCCNDRSRSINFSDLGFGTEWIMVNWPILLFLGMVFGIIVVFSMTVPRTAKLKDNETEDV